MQVEYSERISTADQSILNLQILSTTTRDFAKSYRQLLLELQLKPKRKAYGFYKIYNNYCRGVKFAPEGSHIATNSNDRTIRVFEVPEDLDDANNKTLGDELVSESQIIEGSIIYDFEWHPYSGSSGSEDSHLIATCSQKAPINLWNTKTGTLVASFYARDYSNELESVYSLAFGGFLGKNIIAGLNQYVSIFDLNRPSQEFSKSDFARDCRRAEGDEFHQPQDGIVSCISISPIDTNTFIAGSYGKQIGIYDIRNRLQPEHLLTGQTGGVSHLKFSPIGQHFFSAGRKDDEILCWDIRELGKVCQVYRRLAETNQRITFDVSASNSHLVSGDSKGNLSVWSLNNNYARSEPICHHNNAHGDCLNGVNFHPNCDQILASVSGQRHFPKLISDDSSSSSTDSNTDDESIGAKDKLNNKKSSPLFESKFSADNSLKIWRLSANNN